MHHSRIDDLSRIVTQRTGRRAISAGVLGGLLASLVPGLSATDTAAKRKRKRRCKKSKRRCGKKCVNVKTSRQHCGKCNRTCKSGHACRKGKCTPPPTPPLTCGFGAPCRVFVTKSLYPGNFLNLLLADALCQDAATAAELPGTYKAWLSTSTDSPDTRFAKNPGPYVLVDDAATPIANNWDALTSTNLLHAINLTEEGQAPVGSSGWVWTGTNSGGEGTINTCLNWVDATDEFLGTIGAFTATDQTWSNDGASICEANRHLYCFQQS